MVVPGENYSKFPQIPSNILFEDQENDSISKNFIKLPGKSDENLSENGVTKGNILGTPGGSGAKTVRRVFAEKTPNNTSNDRYVLLSFIYCLLFS